MNKKLLIILMISGLIFTGCNFGTDGKQSGFSDIIGSGSSSSGESGSGVAIEFEKLNFKPIKGDSFSLLATFKNYQPEPVSIRVKPTGFYWQYVEGLEKEFTIDLTPATSTGPMKLAKFFEGITISGFEGDYNWNPIFQYCYETKSIFRELVCVPDEQGACDIPIEPSTYKYGPLNTKVTSVYLIGKDKIGTIIDISNTNNGNVVNDCFQDKRKMGFGNKIDDPVVKLGTEIGDCISTSASNGFVINDNSQTMKCEFPRTQDGVYPTQIVIEYGYKYQQESSTEITIKDLATGPR